MGGNAQTQSSRGCFVVVPSEKLSNALSIEKLFCCRTFLCGVKKHTKTKAELSMIVFVLVYNFQPLVAVFPLAHSRLWLWFDFFVLELCFAVPNKFRGGLRDEMVTENIFCSLFSETNINKKAFFSINLKTSRRKSIILNFLDCSEGWLRKGEQASKWTRERKMEMTMMILCVE